MSSASLKEVGRSRFIYAVCRQTGAVRPLTITEYLALGDSPDDGLTFHADKAKAIRRSHEVIREITGETPAQS